MSSPVSGHGALRLRTGVGWVVPACFWGHFLLLGMCPALGKWPQESEPRPERPHVRGGGLRPPDRSGPWWPRVRRGRKPEAGGLRGAYLRSPGRQLALGGTVPVHSDPGPIGCGRVSHWRPSTHPATPASSSSSSLLSALPGRERVPECSRGQATPLYTGATHGQLPLEVGGQGRMLGCSQTAGVKAGGIAVAVSAEPSSAP